MCSITEKLTAENLTSDDAQPPFSQSVRVTAGQKSLRPPKAALLPEIARLSLEGHSSRAIARKLGVPRRTIDRWLRQQRQQWAESAAENAAELFAVAMARLESVYREAMEAWRRSLADKQVTVETLGSDDAAKPKSTLRKTTQSGQAALLGKAIHAAEEISKFNAKHLEATSTSPSNPSDTAPDRTWSTTCEAFPTRVFQRSRNCSGKAATAPAAARTNWPRP